MAGHSKWANIKHQKTSNDAKKSKLFAKLVKEITLATKQGGSIPANNPRLRLAIRHAQQANLPKENMERAIKKGSGGDSSAAYRECHYEGYTAHKYKVSIIVTCITDNPNRTTAAIRSMFVQHGGSLDKRGALMFLFDRQGVCTLNKAMVADKAALTLSMIEAGATTMTEDETYLYVMSTPENFGKIQRVLKTMSIDIANTALRYVPKTYVTPPEKDRYKVTQLLDALEAHEDVQHVFHNMIRI